MELYPDATDDASPYLIAKYEAQAAKYWDLFYRRNEDRFFKDRHYLHREFPQLLEPGLRTLLEVGCGAGNTCFPLLETFPDLRCFCCDFSSKAVELVLAHPGYPQLAGAAADTAATASAPTAVAATTAAHGTAHSSASSPLAAAAGSSSGTQSHDSVLAASSSGTAGVTAPAGAAAAAEGGPVLPRLVAFVCDIAATSAGDELAARLPAEGVDFVTMVFVLSAIAPLRMPQAVANTVRCLRPGGRLLFRDYSSGDLAQDRLAGKGSRRLGDRFYVRGDGTRCFYFEQVPDGRGGQGGGRAEAELRDWALLD